jgi:hypothetical protein
MARAANAREMQSPDGFAAELFLQFGGPVQDYG